MKPWTSIGTLAVLLAELGRRLAGIEVIWPGVPWWAWPPVLVALFLSNFVFFIWLAGMSREFEAARGAVPIQAVSLIVLLMLL